MSDSGILPLPYDPTDPNGRYSIDSIAVLKSIEDTDKFCRLHSHDNNYAGLALGQRIQINDGIHNKSWYIAGFDVESNKIASDGTTYDNGYGIMLIPETYLAEAAWNSSETTSGGYLNSYMNKTVLVTVANKLKNVLGNHLVNRNVLLSSGMNSRGNAANSYTWTTAYCTLMSAGQMTGTFAQNRNKYDDGEANYKLPLFNYMGYKTGSVFWSRGIYSSGDAWIVDRNGDFADAYANGTLGVRPLIYIR